MIIAVGPNGSRYSINNGASWLVNNSVSGNAIAYGNGLWVVVGNSGSCSTSTDGINWTTRLNATTNFGTRTMSGVAYSADLGLWVASASATAGMFYSSDGINWTLTNLSGGNAINGVCWSAVKGQFGMFGSNRSGFSSDGASWTTKTFSGAGYAITSAFGSGLWVGVGQGVWTSPTMDTWTSRVSTGFYALKAVAYSPTMGRAVAVGDSGAGGPYYSDDGTTWNVATGGSGESTGVCWSPTAGKFFSVDSGGTGRQSSNGSSWSSTPGLAAGFALSAIAAAA